MSEPTDPYSVTTDVRALAAARSPNESSTNASSAASEGSAALASSTGAPSSNASDGAPVAEGEILAGKYRIERVLGQGGVGVVVAATHLILKQRVAIKFLLSNSSTEIVERFLREAQAAAKLKSEHAAKVLDVGEMPNGAPYMVLEFLEGSDLQDHLMFQGPLPIEEAVEYILQACEAMAEAHAAGIVHRDLKPANLFLTQTGGRKLVKVLDFGISKNADDPAGGRAGMNLTKTTAVFGSPLYMPPEQMRSARDVDARSDIWSMGIILYELLTGRTPFDAEMYPDLVVKITIEPAAAPSSIRRDIPSKLDAIILRCLEKKPASRFQDIGKLAAALAPFAPAHARGSIERISRTLEAAAPIGGAAQGGARTPTAAKTSSAMGWSSTGKSSNTKLLTVVALAVAGAAAIVIGGAFALGVFKEPRSTQGSTAITAATESPAGTGEVSAPNGPSSSRPAAAPPIVEPQSPAQSGAAIPASSGSKTKSSASASAQPIASGGPGASAQPAATPSSAPAPQVTGAVSAPTGATPPPHPTTAPTKKNPLDMELRE